MPVGRSRRLPGGHGSGTPLTRRAGRWVALLLATGVVSALLDLAAIPSPQLLAGLVVGLAVALRTAAPPQPALIAFRGAQAVTGVSIGVLVDAGALREIGTDAVPVVLVTLGTLVVSLLAGAALGSVPGVDRLTGALALVAGGASGLTAISRELGADDRTVAVVQYLRVVLVVLVMPPVAGLLGGHDGGSSGPAAADGVALPLDLLLVATASGAGALLGLLLRLPAGFLLGPMLLAAALSASGVVAFAVPPLLQDLAYALIGLQVGLRFTGESLRLVRRALPAAAALIVLVLLACAGLGSLLATTTGHSQLDGFLATNPGGLYAVVATAVGSGADATFVLSVQVLRVLVMLLVAPLLARTAARHLHRRRS